MLIDEDGRVIHEEKTKADMFLGQFSSVHSDPTDENIKDPDFIPAVVENKTNIACFTVTDDLILSAIAEIKLDSAADPYAIPAILLKRCGTSLTLPLRLLWKSPFEQGVVPLFYKQSYVCPLYKKGDGNTCKLSIEKPTAEKESTLERNKL